MYISMNPTLTANRVPWPEFARLAAKTGYPGRGRESWLRLWKPAAMRPKRCSPRPVEAGDPGVACRVQEGRGGVSAGNAEAAARRPSLLVRSGVLE